MQTNENLNLDNELKMISQGVYKGNEKIIPKDWIKLEEFERNEDFIHQQMNLGNVITKAEAEEKIKSGEVIWVDDYVRGDGTHVSGYYRRK